MSRRRPPPALDFLSSPDVFDPELALTAEHVAIPFDDILPLDNLSKCVSLLPGAAPAPAARPRVARSADRTANPAGPAPPAPSVRHCVASSSSSLPSDDTLPSAFGPPAASRSEPQQEKKRSLAQQWAESFQGAGPLGEAGLARWRSRRVRVIVRRQFGVRGWYEGELRCPHTPGPLKPPMPPAAPHSTATAAAPKVTSIPPWPHRRTYDHQWNLLLTNVTEQTVVDLAGFGYVAL